MKNNLRCFILGMRYIAKLLLNSLWGKSIFSNIDFSKSYLCTGKFAQKNIQTHSKCFNASQVDKWMRVFEDEQISVTQVIPISQDIVRVAYKDKRAYVKENNVSNLAVAVKLKNGNI